MANVVLSGAVLSLLIVSVPDNVDAQSASEDVGRILEIEVPAPALDGNLLESPSVQNAAVYLPPGYDGHPEHRFPVLYLLHGIYDDYGVWTEHYDVPSILDQLIAKGEIPELIVVMPNGGNRYGGGYYRNSPVSGNWADYIADDLVGYVDATWRTLPSAESRAVVGHSMGGYGALNLAMNRAGVFSVVWAQSPCCLSPRDDLSFGNDAWKRAAAVKGPDDVQSLIDSGDFYPIAFLGVITAFSPDPEDGPIYGEFPFDVVRGEVVLDEAAFDAYADRFPVRQVRASRDALRGLRGLGIGVGLDDQFPHIPAGALELSQRLGAERVPHQLDVYDGDHRRFVGERLEEIVFPWLAERLVFAE